MQKETFEATIPINYSCKKKEKKTITKKCLLSDAFSRR